MKEQPNKPFIRFGFVALGIIVFLVIVVAVLLLELIGKWHTMCTTLSSGESTYECQTSINL